MFRGRDTASISVVVGLVRCLRSDIRRDSGWLLLSTGEGLVHSAAAAGMEERVARALVRRRTDETKAVCLDNTAHHTKHSLCMVHTFYSCTVL